MHCGKSSKKSLNRQFFAKKKIIFISLQEVTPLNRPSSTDEVV